MDEEPTAEIPENLTHSYLTKWLKACFHASRELRVIWNIWCKGCLAGVTVLERQVCGQIRKVLLCDAEGKEECLKDFEQGTAVRWEVSRSLSGCIEDGFCGLINETVEIMRI